MLSVGTVKIERNRKKSYAKSKEKKRIDRFLVLLLLFLQCESLIVGVFFPPEKTVVIITACIYVCM